MAVEKGSTPEEAILLLSRLIRDGKVTRKELRVEVIRIGLSRQKRWKAIRDVENGKVNFQRGAEMAGLDEQAFRKLLETHGRG